MLFYASSCADVDSPWIHCLRLCIDDWFSANKRENNNIIRKVINWISLQAHTKIAKLRRHENMEEEKHGKMEMEKIEQKYFMLATSPKVVNKHLNIYLSFQPNGSSRYLQRFQIEMQRWAIDCEWEIQFVFVNQWIYVGCHRIIILTTQRRHRPSWTTKIIIHVINLSQSSSTLLSGDERWTNCAHIDGYNRLTSDQFFFAGRSQLETRSNNFSS